MDYKLKRTDFYSTLKILGSEFRDFGACMFILDIAWAEKGDCLTLRIASSVSLTRAEKGGVQKMKKVF